MIDCDLTISVGLEDGCSVRFFVLLSMGFAITKEH